MPHLLHPIPPLDPHIRQFPGNIEPNIILAEAGVLPLAHDLQVSGLGVRRQLEQRPAQVPEAAGGPHGEACPEAVIAGSLGQVSGPDGQHAARGLDAVHEEHLVLDFGYGVVVLHAAVEEVGWHG